MGRNGGGLAEERDERCVARLAQGAEGLGLDADARVLLEQVLIEIGEALGP